MFYSSRVLFEDQVNGEKFNFAIIYNTHNRSRAIDMALEDFPDVKVVEVTNNVRK